MYRSVHLACAIADRCLQPIAGAAVTLSGALDLAVNLSGPRNPHLLAAYDAAAMFGLQLRLWRGVCGALEHPVRVGRLPELLRGAHGWETTRLDLSEMPPRTVLAPPRGRVLIVAVSGESH